MHKENGKLHMTIEASATKETNRVTVLIDPETLLEDRVKIVRELFPANRKEAMLAHASKDSKGRSVRYFRYMDYQELQALLTQGEITAADHPHAEKVFKEKRKEIQWALGHFLKKQGLLEKFENDFKTLTENFTIENYRKFVQTKLPRVELFRLHISYPGADIFGGLTGLTSCSMGAPFMPPVEPTPKRPNPVGMAVIEMVIPDEEVYLDPYFKEWALREMEKEVMTRRLQKDWITTVYISERQFRDEFVRDPRSPLFPYFEPKIERFTDDWIVGPQPCDVLQEWKSAESIAEFIPIAKLPEIDENNPILQKPLVEK